ncbi:DVUA0089 family protein [Terriglobus sp.]|uniref:DVUA0089 family protein n=1 Tax=Terriglobus sp. TaxID=1889013 RepID=UPI003B005B49
MVYAKRLLSALLFCTLGLLFASRLQATPLASGTFLNDDSFYSYTFTTSSTQNFNFATTSYATGGFIPVLTLFNASGGTPLAFAETDNSDVSINQILGPGTYVLFLTQDPNVFTTTLAAGTLFAGQPTFTGDFFGIAGGKFLNFIDGTQRTSSYALTVNSVSVAATPEPATWLLLLPPVAFAFAMRRRSSLGVTAF